MPYRMMLVDDMIGVLVRPFVGTFILRSECTSREGALPIRGVFNIFQVLRIMLVSVLHMDNSPAATFV